MSKPPVLRVVLISRALGNGWVDKSRETELRDYLNTYDGVHKEYILEAMGFGVMAQKDLFLYVDDEGNYSYTIFYTYCYLNLRR